MKKNKLGIIILTILLIFSTAVLLYSEDKDDAMQREVLTTHNKYRAELNIPPLIWSKKLATNAGKWAHHLAHSDGRLYHSKGSGEGENLWQGTAGYFSYSDKVEAWGREKKYFKKGVFPQVSTSENWSDVGHYTQMIWRDTTHVGCATVSVGNYDILVCRYSPPGNFIGKKVY